MAWMLGFSSTLKTSAFSGGFKYRPITSAALGAQTPRRQLRRDTVVRIEPSQRGICRTLTLS
jgi:hypothetical protein